MQWILAYDGACGRCRAIAERVVALGGGRLEARSLREPEVAAWRERALGARAPWEPVLFAVAGDRLQAYTGRRLVLELVRLLGVRRGLALASGLRELTPPTGAGPALTRRRVLGRLAGLGTALGLLVSGELAVPGGAHARGQDGGRPWWAVEPIKTSVLDPAAREKLLAELVAGPDLPAVLGAAELAELQAAEHRLADGRTLWALAGVAGADEVVAAYRDDAGRVAAFRYRLDGETAVLLAASEGGQVTWPVVAGGAFSPAGCPPGYWPCQRCCRVDLGRLTQSCWGCVAACGACRLCVTCLLCISVVCPGSLFWACIVCQDCCPENPPWGP